MDERRVKTDSEKDTLELAQRLALYLKPGDVITLEGNLGTGKTLFTKGIALGLGIKEMLTSPTFTIVKEYEGDLPLYHMDVYRLEHSDEDLGFSEYFFGNGVTVVEWAKFIEDYLPSDRLNIEIEYINETSRVIVFRPSSKRFVDLVHKLLN